MGSLKKHELVESKVANINDLSYRYRDMRLLMGIQVGTLWQSLGNHREHFIPTMIGPFLQLTLVPEEDVRKATLPIIGDMMVYDQRNNGNFAQV